MATIGFGPYNQKDPIVVVAKLNMFSGNHGGLKSTLIFYRPVAA